MTIIRISGRKSAIPLGAACTDVAARSSEVLKLIVTMLTPFPLKRARRPRMANQQTALRRLSSAFYGAQHLLRFAYVRRA
jgi:hypothetical protein